MHSRFQNLLIPTSIALLVTTVAITTYLRFNTYEPAYKPSREVRGTATAKKSPHIPYPPKSIELSRNTTSMGDIISLESGISSQEVQIFYRNVLLSGGWDLVAEGTKGNFEISEYARLAEKVIVSTSETSEGGNTVVTIEKN